MHVAHVLRKLDPAAWGGVETHVHALAAALRARDVGGTIITVSLTRAVQSRDDQYIGILQRSNLGPTHVSRNA